MPAISKVPQKKRTPTRRSEAKLFRCIGFGNCDMVFTRSEHLARHARKHTGEKPFKCVVPNCDRMFSRFDNMMQHTHTHTRTKKKDSSDSSSEGKSSPVSVPEDNSSMHVPAMSPLDNQGYTPQMYYQQPYPHHPPSPTSQQEEDYVKYQHYYNESPYEQQRYYDYYSPSTPPQFHQPMMAPSPQHSVASYSHHSTYSPPRSPANSVQPTADDYGSYSDLRRKQKQYCYGPKNSTHSEKRRLSYIELATPIQQLGTDSCALSETTTDDDDERQMSPLSVEEDRFKIEGIDVTADEYEALQGFSKFCTEPVVREPMLMNSPSCSSVSFPVQLPPLRSAKAVLSSNPSLTSQVYAFRQQIPTSQESFKRAYA